MRIIVIGAGKVGYQIAETLSKESFDVVVIDQNKEVISRVDENLDVLAICSNGLVAEPLKHLAINKNDLLIAVTDSDEGNMLACLSAKSLGGCTTVARIRNPEYANDLALSPLELSIDFVINPEKSTAREISRMLTLSPAGTVEEFAKGAVQMATLPIDKSVGFEKESLVHTSMRGEVLIAAIIRDEQLIIPKGQDVIMPGDTIYIVGQKKEILKFCKSLGKKPFRITNVMILGGSRAAYYLAQSLKEKNISVKLIERDPKRCQELAEMLPNTLIINGDGTDLELLKDEGLENVDAFIGLTGFDEENVLISLLAKRTGAKKVIAKVNQRNFIPLVEPLGIDAAVTPSMITVGEIMRFISGGRVISLFFLLGGKAEIMELDIQDKSPALGLPIKSLAFPKDAIITTIIRNGEVIIPHGDDAIKDNDRVIILSKANAVDKVQDLFIGKGKVSYEYWFNRQKSRFNSSN